MILFYIEIFFHSVQGDKNSNGNYISPKLLRAKLHHKLSPAYEIIDVFIPKLVRSSREDDTVS